PVPFHLNTSRDPGHSRNFPFPSLRNSTLPALDARKKSGHPSLLTSAAATPSPGMPSGKPTAFVTSSNCKLPLLRNRREDFVFDPLYPGIGSSPTSRSSSPSPSKSSTQTPRPPKSCGHAPQSFETSVNLPPPSLRKRAHPTSPFF